MGFFDKVKGFFNVKGATVEITRLEDPFPVGDPVYKASFVVKAGSDVTVKSFVGKLIATWTDHDGKENELLLAEDDVRELSYLTDKGDITLPWKIKAGEEQDFPLFFMSLALESQLKDEWGFGSVSAFNANKVQFKVEVEVDIAEAAGLFDPTAEKPFKVVERE